jgi:hypothetical protein
VFHWAGQKIGVQVFYCVLTLAIAHLMRRQGAQAGAGLTVRELLYILAAIQETVLLYPSAGGRPGVRCMLTGRDTIQQRMFGWCGLGAYIPPLGHTSRSPQTGRLPAQTP